MTDDTARQETGDPTFISALKEGHQRFLAHAIEHSFVCGRRTAQDFIRHFSPLDIMKGLEHQPELRATILVLTTGLKQKIALKKEWQDAGTDLQIALDEGETDAESIVALFAPDDRVRYLDPRKIWNFLVEGEFWRASANKGAQDVPRNHVAFMLERALEDKLLSHRDVVEGITVDELANRLPKAELGRLIQCALKNADKLTVFSEGDLLATTPPRTLVQYVPLPHIWDTVIIPKVAERHGYAAAREAPPAVKEVETPKVETPKVETPKPAVVESAPVAALREAAAAKSAVPKPKDAPAASRVPEPAKDKAKAKPVEQKPAAAEQKPAHAEPKSGTHDTGPTVAKTPQEFFGGEDDIEILEEDVKAS
jgi:hypothetical protein